MSSLISLIEMFFSLTSLVVILSLASSAPLNTEDVVDIIESQHDLDNSINVDERPNKQARRFLLLI